MKERIHKIMQLEKMSQKNFAETLGISQATLSSIFNGRTSPTRVQIDAIHFRFPNISINWLMYGEGEMYIDSSLVSNASDLAVVPDSRVPDNVVTKSDTSAHRSAVGLFNVDDVYRPTSEQTVHSRVKDKDTDDIHPLSSNVTEPVVVREIVKYIDKPQRKIKEIRIFFDDGTYEIFDAL